MAQTNKLPNLDMERTIQDTMKTEFLKDEFEKDMSRFGMHPTSKGPSQQQLVILQQIRDIEAAPVTTTYPGSSRTVEQIEFSQNLHKRVTPGYVDMPYSTTNGQAYKYIPPPDFSKAYLKKKSDCNFQGCARARLLPARPRALARPPRPPHTVAHTASLVPTAMLPRRSSNTSTSRRRAIEG